MHISVIFHFFLQKKLNEMFRNVLFRLSIAFVLFIEYLSVRFAIKTIKLYSNHKNYHKMKKTLFRIAAMLMIAVVAFACNKDPKPGPDDPKPDDKEKTDSGKCSVQITIDGNFSDWDQVTAEAAGKDDCLAVLKAGSTDAIHTIKAASDAANVYIYVEILIDALPQNAICSEWGDSYNGTPEKGYKGDGADNDQFGDVFNLFFDPDGKETTGFYTYEDEEDAAIPGLGCEQCSQINFFWNYESNKLCCAWNQTNVGPTKKGLVGADGVHVEGNYTGDFDYNGTFFQSKTDWPSGSGAEGAFPLWGWQNFDGDGTGDNIAPKPENLAWSASGAIVRIEFAIEKSDLVNLPDDATEYAWGVCYRFTDYSQDIGPVRAKYSE